MWRPPLVVRYGRGGHVASPTSTRSVLLIAGWNLMAVGLMVWMVWPRPPLVIGFLLFSFWTLRDTWAWLGATEEERSRFVALVNATEPRRLSYTVQVGRFTARHSVLLWVAFCASGVGFLLSAQPAWLAGVVILGPVAVLSVFDPLRAARKER